VSDGEVLLKGKAGENSVEFSIAVNSTQNLSPLDADLPIHRLAAKAQIKQLEDGEKGAFLFCAYFSLSHLISLLMIESLLFIRSWQCHIDKAAATFTAVR